MKKAIENLGRGVVLSGALATGISACTKESALCESISSRFGVKATLDTEVSSYRCESKDKSMMFARLHYTKPKERTVCISMKNYEAYTDDNCDGTVETDNPHFMTDSYVLLDTIRDQRALQQYNNREYKAIKEKMAEKADSYAREYFTK